MRRKAFLSVLLDDDAQRLTRHIVTQVWSRVEDRYKVEFPAGGKTAGWLSWR